MSAAPVELLITHEELRERMERVREELHAGRRTEASVEELMHTLRPDLDEQDRWDVWEQFDDATMRLNHIRSDFFDPVEGDREWLEHEADADAANAIEKMRGVR